MAEGLDISEHQGTLPAEFFDQWDYVIIRAFNENGYPDRTFNDNWRKAAGRTLRGVYGWPTPFIPGDDFRLGQVLVDIAPDAEAGYWADREWVGGVASVDEVENYLRGIESRGRLAGVYSNINELPRSPYLDARPWWMADYGPNNGVRHDPWQQAPVPPNDRPFTIHQYTSTPLDRNWSADLAWTGATPTPTPRPKRDDMYIVESRDTHQMALYTALGVTVGIDKGFRDELAFAGVPVYTVPQGVFDSVALIHVDHKTKLLDALPDTAAAASAFDFHGTATPK